MADGKLPPEDRVNLAEDGRGRTDTDREGQYGGDGEPGALDEHPRAVAKVVRQSLKHGLNPRRRTLSQLEKEFTKNQPPLRSEVIPGEARTSGAHALPALREAKWRQATPRQSG